MEKDLWELFLIWELLICDLFTVFGCPGPTLEVKKSRSEEDLEVKKSLSRRI